VRLFVALELAAAPRAALAAVCESGRRGGVRWVPPENAHLTLKFLGEVADALLDDIKGALKAAAAPAKPFELSLAGGGCFPNERAPRVIWLGVGDGREEAAAAAAAVERALAPFGFDRDKRRFHPHVTIGRVKDARRGAATAAAKLEELADFTTPAAPVTALSLIESTLAPAGSVYKTVARFAFGKA